VDHAIQVKSAQSMLFTWIGGIIKRHWW